jgi:PAS domain S-box-containing protein
MARAANERGKSSRAIPEEPRAYLAAIVESSDDAIIGKTLDGTITFWNPTAQRLYGYTPEEAIGRPISLIIPHDRPTEMMDILRRLRRGERIEHFETKRVTKDGRVIDLSISVSPIRDDTGKIIGAASIGRDIGDRVRQEEERRRIERELEFERDRLRLILDLLPEAVTVCDATGRIVMANRASRSIIGRDVLGAHIRLPPEPSFRPKHMNGLPYSDDEFPMQRALHYGFRTTGERMLVHNPQAGLDVPLLVSSSPLVDQRGNVAGAVTVFQDISPLIDLERQRDEWISIITHDLRQPVAVIRSYTDLLHQRLPRRAELQAEIELLDHIRTAAFNMNKMIADLLDVSPIETRRSQIDRRPVDLAILLPEVLDRLSTLVKSHPLRVRIVDSPLPASVDRERFEQIVGNLLSNAAKYSFAGSEIAVEARQVGESAVVSVANQGVGIPAEEIPQLFSRLYRTQRARQGDIGGLGLGLYITRRLIEAHGGKIWVESMPNDTTTFTFSLPLLDTR